jgi:hypothetical protein
VIASRGQVQLGLMMALVVLAAVIGDSVGYEVAKHVGPKLLEIRALNRHRDTVGRDITAFAMVTVIISALVWRLRSAHWKRRPTPIPREHG